MRSIRAISQPGAAHLSGLGDIIPPILLPSPFRKIILQLMFLAFLLLLACSASADQLRFDSVRDWRDWQMPVGAVKIAPTGSIQPLRVTKNIDAARDALQLGGGIRRAGSNPRAAAALLDGNPATGWAPNPDDDPDDWFVEIDLGRSVSAHSIALIFADDAPPFELFDLLLSSGEPQLDQVANPVEGSLLYSIKERFKKTRATASHSPRRRALPNAIRYLQIRNLKHVPDARLVAVEVQSIGDNLTLNLIERGGTIDIVIDVFVRAEEVTLGNALNLVDGSIFNRWRNGREPRNTYNTWSHITIDLGAVYPVDFVRLITGIAIRGGFGEHLLRTRAGASGPRSFSYKNYEVLTSDGTNRPRRHPYMDAALCRVRRQRKPPRRASRPPVPHPADPLCPHRLANLGRHLRRNRTRRRRELGLPSIWLGRRNPSVRRRLPPRGPSPLAAHRLRQRQEPQLARMAGPDPFGHPHRNPLAHGQRDSRAIHFSR